jgi:hypothetical protein
MTELRAGESIAVGDVRITPIVAICLESYSWKDGFCVSAFKGPVHVLVATPAESKAFDLSGAEVDPEDLPELDMGPSSPNRSGRRSQPTCAPSSPKPPPSPATPPASASAATTASPR